MTTAESLGAPYTVTEFGVRHPSGYVESLGADEAFRLWPAIRNFLKVRRGDAEYVTRRVTGRDRVFPAGALLAGAPIKVKSKFAQHPGVPSHVDEATDWVLAGEDSAI